MPGADGRDGAGHWVDGEVDEAVVRRVAARRGAMADVEGQSPAEVKAKTLEAVVSEIGKRWGPGTIVKLGDVRRAAAGAERPRTVRLPGVPAWWPTEDGRRPRILELMAAERMGGLTLSLAWLAAAKPKRAAFVDPEERFYWPVAALCGVDLATLTIVRPPAATAELAFDECAVLLKNEAFDVVLCAMPAGATDVRARTGLASVLAQVTVDAEASLVLVSPPHGRRPLGLPAGGADYRARLVECRWENTRQDTVVVRVRTEGGRSMEGGEEVEHEMRLEQTSQASREDARGEYEVRSSIKFVRPAPALRRVAEAAAEYG